MKILHIADSLTVNGRTILLQELAHHTNSTFEHLIVTLMHAGPLAHRFTDMGINVHALNLYSPFQGIGKKKNILKQIFRFQPDICICWSGDSNLISVIPKLFGVPVIWTIHNSISRWNTIKMRWGVRCAALLSRFVPSSIICCSNKTYEVYRYIHKFNSNKLLVIGNGVDTSRFHPNKLSRQKVIKELGLSENVVMVATAARIGEDGARSKGDFKDLATLFKAAELVCHQRKDIIFILFGLNLNYENVQLVKWLNEYDLQSNVRLLGFRNDVADLYAACDLYAMSSITGEGLPISLLEAMASGAIPICTDSGDVGTVIGLAGIVVPQRDAHGLAEAMLSIANLTEAERAERSMRGIEIVKKSYSIETVARRYADAVMQAVSSGSVYSVNK